MPTTRRLSSPLHTRSPRAALLLSLSLFGFGCAEGGATRRADAGPDASTSSWPLEPLACGTWAEGTASDDDGATRDFYNRAAGLRFRNALGDFVDADGVAQGSVAFAVAAVTDDNSVGFQSWDVTSLVAGWASGTWANKGFLLRSADGPFDFASREHAVAGERPELVVTTESGTRTLDAVADTYLASSTFQGFGDAVTLRVGGSDNLLIRFDVEELVGETVSSATLRLFKVADYGSGTVDVGVFRSSHGYERSLSAPRLGLSAGYLDDADIAAHPSVLLFSDFESLDWGDAWTSGTPSVNLAQVDASEGNGFEPFDGTALRVRIAAGDNYGAALIYKFMDETGAEPEEAYVRYYLRFGEDWSPTDGGKLPGISGTYGQAGWGGRPVDGTDGWSARGTFRTVIPDGNPLARHSAIGSYVYHADMAGQYGDVDLWLDGCAGLLDKSRWYAVETYVKLNTPGQNDGIVRGWVDGRLAYERTDWRFRDVDTLKVEQVWMNFYHGGSAVPPGDLHAYIDNVVIASEYIGPLAR